LKAGREDGDDNDNDDNNTALQLLATIAQSVD
jgi:hypothetical protein